MRLFFTGFHALVTLSLTATVACAPPDDGPSLELAQSALHKHPRPRAETLRQAARRANKLSGTAVNYEVLTSDPAYREALARDYDYITPENDTKWGGVQTTPGAWDFTKADAIFEFARKHHQKVKGHTLLWHEVLPPFVQESLPADELRRLARAHIRTIVGRYRGRVLAWDVVNEAVVDDGSLRDSILRRKLGDDFIEHAFRWAHAADPRARLLYNDYSTETINPKSNGVLALVKKLLRKGTPIDGVGFQMHIDAGQAPSKDEIKANFRRFTALGLSVNISELDVRVSGVPGPRWNKLAVQADVYHRVISACVETPGCDAVTTWGFGDAHSWVDIAFGPDSPLPMDEGYEKKPAWFAMRDAYERRPLPAVATGPERLANGSFESDLSGWSTWGGVLSSSTARAHSGTTSALLSSRTDFWQGPVHDLRPDVEAGGVYRISAFALANQSQPIDLTVSVTCAGQPADYITLARAATAPADTWVSLSGSFAAPWCPLSGLFLYVQGPAAGVDLYVDDVSVREVPAPAAQNLIGNPGFEAGTAGWTIFGGQLSASTTAAHSGTQSGLITARTASWQGPLFEITDRLEAGRPYTAAAFARVGAGTDTAALTAQFRCVGTTDNTYTGLAHAAVDSTTFTKLAGGFVAPTCKLASAYLYVEGPQPGVDLYVDDVELLPSFPLPQSELLSNGGFEAGVSGWIVWGDAQIAQSTAQVRTGAGSGVVTGRTASWQGAVADLTGLVSAGATYTASAWARVASASATGITEDVHLTAQITCVGADPEYHFIAGASATDSAWTSLQGAFTVPTCPLAGVFVYVEGPAPGVDLFVDDASVHP